MYCPHCSQYIVDLGDFDDGDYTSASESYSWSYDEDEMSIEEPMLEQGPGFRSPLKRARTEALSDSDGNLRPLKRRNVLDPMDVDSESQSDDMSVLYSRFNKMTLN